MATCPSCGVTVAFHSEERTVAEMDCWTCSDPLIGEWKQEPGHLGRWVARIDETKKFNRDRARRYREAKREAPK